MKTNIIFLFIAAALISSCSKNNSTTNNPNPSASYINTDSSSSWSYHETDSSSTTPKNSDYTVTSTPNDTTINSKKYHVYSYSYGGSEYLNLSGSDYYQYDSIPVSGVGTVERLYLKDNLGVGGTWSQTFNVTIPNFPASVPLNVTNTIVEKGISLTVNNISYTNVIHVSTSLSSSILPASALVSAIDSYYAPNYGLIQNSTVIKLNYFSVSQNINIKTQLTSSSLK